MGQRLELAKRRLFDKDSLAVNNIKLFPGNSRDTSPDEFAEEINKAISQIEANDFDEVSLENSDSR